MSKGQRFRVQFRRRRQGRTDYRYRLKLLKSGKPRATVRVTNKRVLVAIESFDPKGDVVKAMADSRELVEIGFLKTSLTSTPAAYLTGYLAGLRSLSTGEGTAVLDGGLTHPTPGGRVMGALKGMLDSGMEIPHSEEGLPSKERLAGKHLKPPMTIGIESLVEKLQTHIGRGSK